MKRVPFAISAMILVITLVTAACAPGYGQKYDFTFSDTDYAVDHSVTGFGDYFINILVLEKGSTFKSQLKQSLVYNVVVDETPTRNLNEYDLVVVAGEPEMKMERLVEYAREGGVLVVYDSGMAGVLDTVRVQNYTVNEPVFSAVSEKFSKIQNVLQARAKIYAPVYCTIVAKPASQNNEVLMKDKQDNALALHQKVGKGSLLWFSDFIPQKYSADISFRGDKPFHPGYAALTGYVLDEIIHMVSLDKYGFSLERPLGPYGKPIMAWQNHFEAAEVFDRNDYKKWYYWLQKYRQIPTFSLIRGSYDWGFWWAGVCINKNETKNGKLKYQGVNNNSFYACGQILRGEKGYIRYGPSSGYKTLMAELESPLRTVPQIIGDKLLIGAPNGKVYAGQQKDEVRYVNFKPVKGVGTGSLAAPYYEDGYLVLGGDEKGIKVYREEENFSFSFVGRAGYKGKDISLTPPLVPVLYNGELYVGDAEGNVYLYSRQKGDFNYQNKNQLIKSEETQASPFPFDINGDGAVDLLVGGKNGKVAQYLNHDGTYKFSGYIRGEIGNFFYTKDIKIGQYSIPRMTKGGDLYLGGAMYGLPYDISDKEFPYRNGISDMVDFMDNKELTPGAHVMVNPSATRELEDQAYKLHAGAFEKLGIQWQDMGVNHHSWFITNPEQTFNTQAKNGIRFNFGWCPPGIPGAPKDAQPFAVVRPFMYNLKEADHILLYQPAPNISLYKGSWDFLAQKRMPLTYFQHIEYIEQQRKNLDRLIHEIEDYGQRYGYVFGTEYQMAQAIVAGWYTDLHVEISGEELIITPSREHIPDWVGEYAATAGVTVRTAEKGTNPFSDSLIQHYSHGQLTIGLPGTQTVDFKKDIRPEWWIVGTNSPVLVKDVDEKVTLLKLPTDAFQEIYFAGDIDEISYTGGNVLGTRFAAKQSVIHYGSPITIQIRH
mgnify:CR=1 FL=1